MRIRTNLDEGEGDIKMLKHVADEAGRRVVRILRHAARKPEDSSILSKEGNLMSMTCLNLLSPDGALSVTFRPRLSSDKPYRLIPLIDSRDQLIQVLRYFSKTHAKT